jgi:hypothetical protein
VRDREVARRLEGAIGALRAGAPVREEALAPELRGILRVAHRLAVLDLVRESRVRESLRGRLERAMEERRTRAAEPAVRRHWVMRRPVLATELGVLLVVALLAVVAPRSLAALVEPVVRMIERVRVGDHTEIIRDAPRTAADVSATLERSRQRLASGESWFLHTPYGGFGGRVPPGSSDRVQRVSSLERLRPLTHMRIRVPTGAHRDVPVRFDHAYVAPGGIALVYFGSGANELLLAAFPVGEGRAVGYSRMQNRTTPDGRTVFESPELKTEELSLGGQLVVWDPDPWGPGQAEGSALRWEEDGASYSLMGRSLTREEAVELFLSRRPLDEAP